MEAGCQKKNNERIKVRKKREHLPEKGHNFMQYPEQSGCLIRYTRGITGNILRGEKSHSVWRFTQNGILFEL